MINSQEYPTNTDEFSTTFTARSSRTAKWSIMLATRLDQVGQAAVLRETSVVFAALIGWVMLGEQVGPRRLGLIALIALGAVIVEFSG